MNMQKRIFFIGAGSTNFGLVTIGDLFKSKVPLKALLADPVVDNPVAAEKMLGI